MVVLDTALLEKNLDFDLGQRWKPNGEKNYQCAQLPLCYKISLGRPADTAAFANPLSLDESSASDPCFLLI